jgi:tetratricopeptide (TPR) repeat protein
VSAAERIRLLRQQGQHEAALRLAVDLSSQEPGNARAQYEAACVHDYLGHEAAAMPFYLAAIAAGLSGEQLRSAYLGLGSTYRTLGRYEEALATFNEGQSKFPDAAELKVFKSMALYNVGRNKEAVANLLMVVAATSNDQAVQSYRRAIALYAEDLDRRWQCEQSGR